MERADITTKLTDLLKQQQSISVNTDALSEASRLDSLGFDSITIMDFVYDMEVAFGVETNIEDLVPLETIGELLDYLQAKLPS